MMRLRWLLLLIMVCVSTISSIDFGDAITEVLFTPITEGNNVVSTEPSASVTTMVNSNKACDGDAGNKTQLTPEQLHEQVAALTNQLSKALAILTIAQKRERGLTLTEKEKYR